MFTYKKSGFLLLTVLTTCHAFCGDGAKISFQDNEYCFHTKEPLNYFQANVECIKDDSQLASVQHVGENGYIQRYMDVLGKDGIHFWIGLTSVHRPLDSFRWTDGREVEYNNLPKKRSTEAGDIEGKCAAMKKHSHGSWFYGNCMSPQAFICKKSLRVPTLAPPPVAGYCPIGYFGLGNKCYKVVTTKDNSGYGVFYSQAQAECKKAEDEGYIKPDLASIASAEENAEVTSLLYREEGNFWIGLQKTDDAWRWTDGSPTYYSNWDVKPSPDHMYGAIHGFDFHGGKWISQELLARHGYVCEVMKDPDNIINTPDPNPCRDCPANCPEGYISYWKACYKIVNVLSTWDKALEHCKSEEADLVTIQNEIENDAVFMFFQTHPTQGTELWMGMKDKSGSGDFLWENGWPVLYSKWDIGEPSHQGRCTAMGQKGEWIAAGCEFEKPYMCKYTTSLPVLPIPSNGEVCPSPNWKNILDSCFYFYSTRVNWDKATATCKQLHPDASLAYITNSLENQLVANELRRYNVKDGDFYIGLYREMNREEFKWYDRPDIPLSYINWIEDGPLQSLYVVMLREETVRYGQWTTHSKNQISNVICKMGKIKEHVMPPDVPGSCPGSTWKSYGDLCLLFETENLKDWNSAREECKKQGGDGASLVTFSDYNKHRYAWFQMHELLVGQIEKVNFWNGLKRDSIETAFYWTDTDETLDYTNWSPGQPDTALSHFCGAVNMEEGQWFDEDCSEFKPFVCQVAKEPASENSGLSGGAVAGIVIGVLVAVALIAIVAGFLYQRKGGKLPSLPTPGISFNRFDDPGTAPGGLPAQASANATA